MFLGKWGRLKQRLSEEKILMLDYKQNEYNIYYSPILQLISR